MTALAGLVANVPPATRLAVRSRANYPVDVGVLQAPLGSAAQPALAYK